jgi:hypothetical protein
MDLIKAQEIAANPSAYTEAERLSALTYLGTEVDLLKKQLLEKHNKLVAAGLA